MRGIIGAKNYKKMKLFLEAITEEDGASESGDDASDNDDVCDTDDYEQLKYEVLQILRSKLNCLYHKKEYKRSRSTVNDVRASHGRLGVSSRSLSRALRKLK